MVEGGASVTENSTSIFGLPNTIDILGTHVTPFTIILTLAIIIAGFVLAHGLRLITIKYLGARLPPDTRKVTGKTIYYGIIAIALLSALGVSGLNLSGLFLAGGFAGIVIGFATQSLFSNLISGIFLNFDKPMKMGDPVLITGKLPDIAGVVVEVTALSTRLRMYDGTHVRLPNSDVFLSEIRNFSASAAKRIEITIFVSYMSDTQKAIKLIRQKLAEVPLVLVEPVPDVYVDILGESGVNLNVWCWAPFTAWFDVKKMLIDQLKVTLQANDIELTIPRRIIYLEKDGKKPFTKETNSAITTNTTTTPNTATTASNPSSSPGVNLEEVIKD